VTLHLEADLGHAVSAGGGHVAGCFLHDRLT
jgi:hypothetical protein